MKFNSNIVHVSDRVKNVMYNSQTRLAQITGQKKESLKSS